MGEGVVLAFLLFAVIAAMLLVAVLVVGLVVGPSLAMLVGLPVALNRALQRWGDTWQERLALAMLPAVVAALGVSATWGADIGLVVAGTWLAVGAGVAFRPEARPAPHRQVDRVELARDPRWRLAWWMLSVLLAVALPAGPASVGAAGAACLVGCLHAKRRLRVLQRGILLTERVLFWTRERFLDADTLTLRAERTWWGGRIELADGVKVRTGELPHPDWLDDARHLARRAGPHLVVAPGRAALDHLRGARAAG